jgi:hypothetical protein
MNASSQCPHSDLHIHVHHVHLADCNVHYLEVKATCNICKKPMLFRGLPLGLSPNQPTAELGGQEARLPVIGEGEEPAGDLIGFIGGMIGAGS